MDERIERASSCEQHSTRPNVLELMKKLYELLEKQERYEILLLAAETECSIQYTSEHNYAGKFSEFDLMLLRSDLDEVMVKKNQIKDKIANQENALKRLNNAKEKHELKITVGLIKSIEKRIEVVLIIRKENHRKIRDMKNEKLLRSSNENSVQQIPSCVNCQSASTKNPRPPKVLNNLPLNPKFLPIRWEPNTKPGYLRRSDDMIQTGLQQLDQSSYINSIVQCLGLSPLFADYFTADAYLNDFLANCGYNTNNGRITDEFGQLMKALWCSEYQSISAWAFKSAVLEHPIGRQIDDSVQPDVRDFLRFLLQTLHHDLKGESNIFVGYPQSPAENAWIRQMGTQTSIISDLFLGQLRLTFVCMTCKFNIVTHEIFHSLNIPLPAVNASGSTKSLRLAIAVERYFKKQIIPEWECPNCGVTRDAMRNLQIEKLPPIVIVCLDRLEMNGNFVRENNIPIDFERAGQLLFKSYMVEDRSYSTGRQEIDNYRRKLYAMSSYQRNPLNQDHYISFAKIRENWYSYNDNDIIVMAKDGDSAAIDKRNTNAYVLFYKVF